MLSEGYITKLLRSISEEARDVARAIARTSAFEQSSRDRKRIEMLFAPSAFCGSGVCDCAGRAVLSSSLRSQPSPRTYVGWQSLSPGHHQRSMHVLRNQWGTKSISRVVDAAVLEEAVDRKPLQQNQGNRVAITIADFCNKIGT